MPNKKSKNNKKKKKGRGSKGGGSKSKGHRPNSATVASAGPNQPSPTSVAAIQNPASSTSTRPTTSNDAHQDFGAKFASTLSMLRSILDADRMTSSEYHAVTSSLRNGTVSESEVVSEWVSYSLPLPSRVKIVGLANRTDLNGRTGKAWAWVVNTKRYSVQLDGDGEKVNVRPENVVPLPSSEGGSYGTLRDGRPWTRGKLRCDGRLPVCGEVSYILDVLGEEEMDDLADVAGHLSSGPRPARALVFTFEGYVHRFDSTPHEGAMLVPSSEPIKLDRGLVVRKAFYLKGKKHSGRIFAIAQDEDESSCFALLDLPDMRIVKLWHNPGFDEAATDTYVPCMSDLADCYENLLAMVFWKGNSTSRLSCYEYFEESPPYLHRTASWDLSSTLRDDTEDGRDRLTSVCVISGGSVQAEIVSMAMDGTLRLWRTDSPAGCVATFGTPIPTTFDRPMGIGLVSRIPRIMQEQLSANLQLSQSITMNIMTIHEGTLSFWTTSKNQPRRLHAIYNPETKQDYLSPNALVADHGLSHGVIIQVGNISVISEQIGGPWEAKQIVIWDPWRGAVPIAFEAPAKFEISGSSVRFSGGRLLVAGGVHDDDKRDEFGKSTCYTYILSALEEDMSGSRMGFGARIGIDSRNVPGVFSNLLAPPQGNDPSAWYDGLPVGLNISICQHNIDIPGVRAVSPPDVRPCQHHCHNCGRIRKRDALMQCNGCMSALYCSMKCQEKAQSQHSVTCEGIQSVMRWLSNQGLR